MPRVSCRNLGPPPPSGFSSKKRQDKLDSVRQSRKRAAVAPKGTGEVNMLGMTQYSHGRMRVGRARPSPFRDLKSLNEMRPYIVTKFQGLSNFADLRGDAAPHVGTYGLMPRSISLTGLTGTIPLSSTGTIVTAQNSTMNTMYTYLPMYAYNLSCLPVGYVGDPEDTISQKAFSQNLYQLARVTLEYKVSTQADGTYTRCNYYAWLPCRGQQNSVYGNGAKDAQGFVDTTYDNFAQTPQVEANKFNTGTQAPKYEHCWSDIKVAFYGAQDKNTCMRVSVVNFNEEAIAPSRIHNANGSLFSGPISDDTTNPVIFKDLDSYEFARPTATVDTQVGKIPSWMYMNLSGGLVSGMPGLIYSANSTSITNPPVGATDRLPDIPTEITSATLFWDTYWANRLGHPIAYTKNYDTKRKWFSVKSTKCITIAGQNSQDPNSNTDRARQPRQHIEHIKHAPRKIINTFVPPVNSNNSFGVTVPLAPGAGTSMQTGYNTWDGVNNTHIYGSNRRRDDWLIIECDNMQQKIAPTTQLPFGFLPAGATSYIAGGLGPAGQRRASYVTGSDIAAEAYTWPSFDISIRARHNVVRAGN